MLASNTQYETIAYFLHLVWVWNPDVWPAYCMTDCDQAQIAAMEAIYPQSNMLLCRWHVLHAVQLHFRTDEFPDLWILIKRLVQTTDACDFGAIWAKICSDPSFPQSFVSYFETKWIPIVHMWSAVTRRYRTIYEESDTNMLLERYVHILSTG